MCYSLRILNFSRDLTTGHCIIVTVTHTNITMTSYYRQNTSYCFYNYVIMTSQLRLSVVIFTSCPIKDFSFPFQFHFSDWQNWVQLIAILSKTSDKFLFHLNFQHNNLFFTPLFCLVILHFVFFSERCLNKSRTKKTSKFFFLTLQEQFYSSFLSSNLTLYVIFREDASKVRRRWTSKFFWQAYFEIQ